jgi:hypothetical protein
MMMLDDLSMISTPAMYPSLPPTHLDHTPIWLFNALGLQVRGLFSQYKSGGGDKQVSCFLQHVYKTSYTIFA